MSSSASLHVWTQLIKRQVRQWYSLVLSAVETLAPGNDADDGAAVFVKLHTHPRGHCAAAGRAGPRL